MSSPKQKHLPSARRIFEKANGIKVPPGYEIHHKLPVRLGGSHEDPDNLVMLTLEEHKKAHLDLYEEHGDFRDLCAYHLIGGNFAEAARLACSKGGLAAAASFKRRGVKQGFQLFEKSKMIATASAGGKAGGARQRDLGLGIHAQTREERLLIASAGGKKGCLANGWKDPLVQSENGKRGGVKNKGFRWYNDGVNQFKYTSWEQSKLSFGEFISINGFSKGRLKAAPVVCPHCGAIGPPGAMGKWHLDNCRKKI